MNYSIEFPNLHIHLNHVIKTISIGNFSIAMYGICIAIGMLLAVSLAMREAKRVGASQDKYLDIILVSIVLAIIGARLYYVAFSWDSYKNDLLSIFNIRGGGLAIYGGVLFGALGVVIFGKIWKQNVLQMLDTVVLGVLIGQICGRWGNFFNREAFGEYTNGLLAMRLPVNAVRSHEITELMWQNAVTIDGSQYIQVAPTFLYESLWNVTVLIILYIYRTHKHFDGEILLGYCVGYGLGRFWIEGLRTDQLILWNTNIPVSQAVGLIGAIVGAILIAVFEIRYYKRKKAQ